MGFWNWLFQVFGGAPRVGVNYRQLRKEVRAAARAAFAQLRAEHPDETFYTFALYSDDNAMTICPAANSEEGLRRRLERGSDESARWFSAEWAYECHHAQHFEAAYKRINAENRYDPHAHGGFAEFIGQVFATMVLSLRDLDREGFFGRGAERERVTLFCTVSDSKCATWLEEESARRLNSPAVSKAFIEALGYSKEVRTRDRAETRVVLNPFVRFLNVH